MSKFVIHSGIRLVFTPNSFTSRFHFHSFSISFQSATKMPVYKVQIDKFRERILYFFLNSASSEVFSLGQSLETDTDIVENCDSRNFIVENCVIPETLFRMQHTWMGSRSGHKLTNECKFLRSIHHVSSERKPSARLPIAD